MSSARPMSFDEHAATYTEDLGRGLSLSGEPAEFFARGRLQAVEAFFARHRFAPRRVVEFGCGIGTNLGVIREMWPAAEIVGLDRSEGLLAVAREKVGPLQVRFVTDRQAEPDPEREESGGQADWLFCNGVLHHVPEDEQVSALRNAIRLVRPGGAFTLFDNNPFNPGARLVMRRIPFDRDARLLDPYLVGALLERLGVARLECRFLFVFPRWVSVLRPAERYLHRMPLGAQYGWLGFRSG